jgi:hypothetical protein
MAVHKYDDWMLQGFPDDSGKMDAAAHHEG